MLLQIQNEKLVTLTNKDYHKGNYQEIFAELIKERFGGNKELTDKTNQNGVTYFKDFKYNTSRKRFGDFKNSIELFKKIKSCERKLEKAKNLQSLFESNLNEISRGRG